MFGLPLHPLVVHFPIVLSVLLPLVAMLALWSIRKGTSVRRAWAVPVAVAIALWLASFVAVRSGEAEEDVVERVVAERVLHSHEEAGERFLVLSGVVALIAAAGFLPRTVGSAARFVSVGATLLVLAAGAQVGHSGGALVYQHGAASAYAEPTPGAAASDDDVATARRR